MFEKITSDIVDAMKRGDKLSLSVLRMVKGAMQLEVIEKKRDLTDDEVYAIITKQVKLRNDSIEEFKKASRVDLVDSYSLEIEILSKYLPKQLTNEEVDEMLNDVLTKVKPNGINDIGLVMKEIMPLVKGKTDMGKLNLLIKDKLSKL